MKNIILTYSEFITENSKSILTIYHGTHSNKIENILEQGLISNVDYYSPGWYMVATDFDSALYHATVNQDDNAYVIEMSIPIFKDSNWLGYPYLWKGCVMSDKSTWFALKQPIPPTMITKIHEIDYESWLKQKDIGY